jgi:uncharacterized protein YecT (DUF1311 family)
VIITRSLRAVSTFAIGLLIFQITYQIGPAAAHETDHLSDQASIDCNSVKANPASSTVARILCSGSDGASADWDLNSALWAVAGTNNERQQKLFDQEQDRWRDWLNKICFPTRLGRNDRTSTLATSIERQCVVDAFHKRATFLRSGLHDDALAESTLTPEQHAEVQTRLKARGFLQTEANGEFNSNTRKAIKAFQAQNGSPENGFLSEIQMRKLAEDRPNRSGTSATSSNSNSADPRPTQQSDGPPILARLTYEGKDAVSLIYRGVSVTVDNESAAPEEGRLPVATLKYGDGKTLALRMTGTSGLEEPRAEVRIMHLDLTASFPQIVFTYYWAGAHCCTVTKIATMDSSGFFKEVDGGVLDGDGYDFEDLDGDGILELVSTDNSFLYAFASYAESVAPLRIKKLIDGKLRDVTKDSSYRTKLRENLRQLEAHASWNDNGFLAGWVATKSQLGEVRDAWPVLLKSFDRDSNWTMEGCELNVPQEQCPKSKVHELKFPEALVRHLEKNGYITIQERDAIRSQFLGLRPEEKESLAGRPEPSNVGKTNLLELCSAAIVDPLTPMVVDSLIAGGKHISSDWTQSFKDGLMNDYGSFVSVRDDATLEKVDEQTGKVGCAVTVKADLKGLAGKVLDEGATARAQALIRQIAQEGNIMNRRLKYTVQKTSGGSLMVWFGLPSDPSPRQRVVGCAFSYGGRCLLVR